MTRINLLPPDVKAAQARKQQIRIAVVVGGAVIMTMLGLWAMRFGKAASLSRRINTTTVELERYRPIVDKVTSLESTRNQIKTRLDVIQQLLKAGLLYPVFFETFLSLKPNGVWLTSMDTQIAGDGLKLTISAQSSSNYAIADWIYNLENSKYFSSVELGAISASGAGSDAILTFSLSCGYAEIAT